MMGLEPENPYSDWSCEVNSDGEEVCTCRDYTDNDTSANSEDELSMSRKFIFMFFQEVIEYCVSVTYKYIF